VRVTRRHLLALGSAGVLAACAGPAPTATAKPGAIGAPPNKEGWTPILPSSDLAVGQNRFLYALLDERNRPILDAKIHLRFFDLAKGDAVQAETDPVFRGQGLGAKGVYVTRVALTSAGDWGVEAQISRPDGSSRTLRTRFTVSPESKTPKVGSPALPTKQALMAGAADPHLICTNVPACSYHDVTIADALARKKPILLLFATPGYCSSATCGPDLQTVQSLEPEFGQKATFIHVEIYQDPNTQTPLPAVTEWRLPSEPWVFLIDKDGKIADKLEGGLTADELKEGLARLV
jgi:hypothetical protein